MHPDYNEASKYLGTSAGTMFQPWDHDWTWQYHKTEEEDSLNDDIGSGHNLVYMLKQRPRLSQALDRSIMSSNALTVPFVTFLSSTRTFLVGESTSITTWDFPVGVACVILSFSMFSILLPTREENKVIKPAMITDEILYQIFKAKWQIMQTIKIYIQMILPLPHLQGVLLN
jgi:hypothetical protein